MASTACHHHPHNENKFLTDTVEIEGGGERHASSVPVQVHQLTTVPRKCASGICRVPPSPALLKRLLDEFTSSPDARRLKFRQWLAEHGHPIGCPTTIRGAEEVSRNTDLPIETGLARVQIPSKKINGDVTLMVLLVEFPDAQHKPANSKERWETLLFSEGKLSTGSLKEYYREVSLGKVNIKGYVSQWLMMPRGKSYYVGKPTENGTGSYPHNAQKLAADAIKVALSKGIVFPKDLDFKQDGSVGAFYMVAAGRGAEETRLDSDFWSHKSSMRKPVKVGERLAVATYLMVPEDAQVGVCAHELGHLAFEWDDFYDPGNDGSQSWDGAGKWDLMAGGSWQQMNVPGDFPCPPAGLHRSQHGWVSVTDVASTTLGVKLPPQTSSQASVIRIRSPAYAQTQFLLLENRSLTKGSRHDQKLPGGGLLVWRVDTAQFQELPDNPGMMLVQADKRDDLQRKEQFSTWNDGDGGDPFPGLSKYTTLTDALGSNVSTSFPSGSRSGVSLKNISADSLTDTITLDIVFEDQLTARL